MKKVEAENKKGTRRDPDRDTMRSEDNFSRVTRGITTTRYAQGTNVVVLDPDVVSLFPNAASVNDALRALGRIIRQTQNSNQNSGSQQKLIISKSVLDGRTLLE